MPDEGTVALQITPADRAAVERADPLMTAYAALHAEKVKNVALIRTLIEVNAKLDALEAKSNHRSKAAVPAKAE